MLKVITKSNLIDEFGLARFMLYWCFVVVATGLYLIVVVLYFVLSWNFLLVGVIFPTLFTFWLFTFWGSWCLPYSC